MAKKAAQKGSATKAKEKPKATKTASKAAPKKATTKPVAAKPSKAVAKEKVSSSEKPARAPKLTVVPDPVDEVIDSTEETSVKEKPAKAPKVKQERVSAAQRKLDKAVAESTAQWSELHQKHSSEKPQVYDMKAQFEAHRPLQHKVLGWGWIMSVENDRLEVIFQDGKRMLISNYKAR